MINSRKQRGFSLIELLVAVVIMAVGILGIAGLQVVALQQNRSALLRAEATQLANDILDRVRVNKDITYTSLIDQDPPTSKNCAQVECTPAEMSDYDLAKWKCSIDSTADDGTTFTACNDANLDIDGALPGGAGSINLAGNVYTVTVQWEHDSEGNTSSVTVRSRVN